MIVGDSQVEVSAWVKIGSSTSIDYHVFNDGLVEFSIGRGDFDLVTTERGLHNLLVHGEQALRAARSAIAASAEAARPANARPPSQPTGTLPLALSTLHP
jgi:hypothetical protein